MTSASQSTCFSRWNLRRHVYQRHDLYVPDDKEPWRPPTDAERSEMEIRLDKRKANADQEGTPSKQKALDHSLESSFDPNGVLSSLNTGEYDPFPGGLLGEVEEEDEGECEPAAVVRGVSTVAPAAAAPIDPIPATGTAASLPLVCATPDQVLSPEEMAELFTANPELDVRSYSRFLAKEHHLDAQSVVAVKDALERCRRHLKHFAETVLLDNLQARLGGASDPNGDVVRNLLKQTGRSSADAPGALRPNTL